MVHRFKFNTMAHKVLSETTWYMLVKLKPCELTSFPSLLDGVYLRKIMKTSLHSYEAH